MDGLDEEEASGTDDKDVIERASSRLASCIEATQESRKESMKQLKFRHGDQWEATARKRRESGRRACLTVNRTHGFVHSITNDQRQNRPSIHINPVDETSDPATAKIYKGLIRHIEYDSGADMAYDTAHDYAVTMGFGYYKIATQYDGPKSFAQEIKIKPVLNPFNVHFDHLSVEPDGADAKWHLELIDPISTAEFKRQHKGFKAISFTADGEIAATTGTVQRAEYFEIVETPSKIHQLQDGTVVYHGELTAQTKPLIVATRDSHKLSIRGYQLSGDAVLMSSDWPIDILPMVPVYGNVAYVDGKRMCYGLIKDLMDPARMYNYWITTATELVANAPEPAYIVAEGQIAGYENEWENANHDHASYRTYIPKTINGTVVGPPQREVFAGVPTGIIQMLQLASEDMKVTTGIYDAGLGNQSNETSGVAITARQKESEVSNFHYQDNFNRSHRQGARILLALIPKVIDTPRAVRILGEDDKAEIVQIYKPEGAEKGTNLSIGKYDVTITPGPSFTTKRQEFAESAVALAQSVPQLWQVAGHMIIKAMNWPNADEIAELWQAAFSPQGGEQEGIPPELQQQMQMKEQQLQELQQQLQQVTAQAEDKQAVEQLKASVSIEIEKIRATSKMDVEEFKAAAQLIMQGMQPPESWLVEDQGKNTDASEPTPSDDPADQPSGERIMQ